MVKKELSYHELSVASRRLDADPPVGGESGRLAAVWTHWADTQVAWGELFLAIAESRMSVKLSAAWLRGAWGERLQLALLAAANRGVRVQVLGEPGHSGASGTIWSVGLAVRRLPLVSGLGDGPLVVDDRGAYLLWQGAGGQSEYPCLMRLFGPVATELGRTFNQAWEYVGGHPVLSRRSPVTDDARVVQVAVGSAEGGRAYADVLTVVSAARHRLDICLGDDADAGLVDALCQVARTGVVVRCIATGSAEASHRLALERLRRSGVAVRMVKSDSADGEGGVRLVLADGQSALWAFRPLTVGALTCPGLGWLQFFEGDALGVCQGIFTRLWVDGIWLENLSVLACVWAMLHVAVREFRIRLVGWIQKWGRGQRMWHLMRVAPGRWRVLPG